MNQYNKQPLEVKTLLQFNQWLMWSIGFDVDFDVDYYRSYMGLRHWCVDKICENDIYYKDIPQVTDDNQNTVFKKIRNEINLKAFKDLDTHMFSVAFDGEKYIPVIDKP